MKSKLKEALVMIEGQIMRITIALLACLGFMRLLSQDFDPWSWYFPFQIIGISVPTGLCSLVFYSNNELNRKQFFIRVIIHFILVVSLVLLEGFFFKWWSNLEGMLIVLLVFACVYAAVWIASSVWEKKDSERINAALRRRSVKKTKDNE